MVSHRSSGVLLPCARLYYSFVFKLITRDTNSGKLYKLCQMSMPDLLLSIRVVVCQNVESKTLFLPI